MKEKCPLCVAVSISQLASISAGSGLMRVKVTWYPGVNNTGTVSSGANVHLGVTSGANVHLGVTSGANVYLGVTSGANVHQGVKW